MFHRRWSTSTPVTRQAGFLLSQFCYVTAPVRINTADTIRDLSMESFNLLVDQLKLEPRTFVLFNLTTGTVSSAYGTLIILAISFAIAAIGGLLYYGLQNMSSTSYGYGYNADSYNYQRSVYML